MTPWTPQASSFDVTLGSLRGRLDVGYALSSALVAQDSNSPYPLVELGEIAQLVQYGSSALSGYGDGLPILRMNNLGPDGWNLADVKNVELPDREVPRYRLSAGDILIIRTNGSRDLVGKAEVFDLEGDWLFASYLIRVRVNPGVDPRYVAHFLNSPEGRGQITQSSRQILMTNVNSSELRSVRLPLPPIEVQERLADGLDEARRRRASLQAGARKLLEEVPMTLQASLGIDSSLVQASPFWGTTIGDLRSVGRLDAGAGHPARTAAVQSIRDAASASGLSPTSLGEAVRVVRGRIQEPKTGFIGLADVEGGTGLLREQLADQASGSGTSFEPGDILYARLRPYLRKVVLAEAAGECSPEFLVLRVKDKTAVDPLFLSTLLLAPAIVGQATALVSGNTLPRVSATDAMKMLVLLPTFDVQTEAVAMIIERRAQAAKLRSDAADQWEAARAAFTEAVMGGPR